MTLLRDRKKRHTCRPSSRRCPARLGAVAVEFAVVAPVLLAIVVGLIELSRVYNAQNLLQTAAREGARFASMDRAGMLSDGETANAKLENDVKNYLASTGMDRDSIDVQILDHDNPDQTFNLDDPANDLKLFDVTIEAPYSSVSYTPVPENNDYTLTASITFRNGRLTYSD